MKEFLPSEVRRAESGAGVLWEGQLAPSGIPGRALAAKRFSFNLRFLEAYSVLLRVKQLQKSLNLAALRTELRHSLEGQKLHDQGSL